MGDSRSFDYVIRSTSSRLRKLYVSANNAEAGKNDPQRSQYVTSADVGPWFTHTKLHRSLYVDGAYCRVIGRANSAYDVP